MSASMVALIIYGLLLLIAGYFGWKAGSQISLIMGIASGVVTLIGVYLIQNNPRLGYGIIAVLSSTLVIMFLVRFLKTYKVMPSGMLLAVSLAAAIIAIKNFLKS